MNKFFKLASLSVFATVALVFTSCSDDDEPVNNPTIKDVFTEGLPASVDGATFTTNDKGQVTKITEGSEVVTFEYGDFSRATKYNAKMSVRDTNYPDDGSDFYLQLNNKGFITYALQVYLDPKRSDDTWKFEYNNDGQLTKLERSESGDVYQITYTNGDITKVVKDDEDGNHHEYTFNYTNSEFTQPKANKGNIMLFDNFFNVDMDEMGVAYFAGLLGKSTKNLPMGYTENGTTEVYHWTFDSNGFPTKFWEGQDEWYTTTFTWK